MYGLLLGITTSGALLLVLTGNIEIMTSYTVQLNSLSEGNRFGEFFCIDVVRKKSGRRWQNYS